MTAGEDVADPATTARAAADVLAERTGVAPGELMLVAAHGWDISGALAAGCRAAFVARPGALLDPEGPQPEIVASGLAAVVEGIIALF